ncbi:MAG: EAL domain-containing protein [Methyloligellaceae bacterium]
MRKISILYRYLLLVVVAVGVIGVIASYFVSAHYNNMLTQRKDQLKHQIDIAIALILQNRELAKKNGKSKEQADKETLSKIEKIQYGTHGYFYVFEKGIVRYHGVMPHIIGRDLIDIKDANGIYLIRKQVKEIAEKGESSFRYAWLQRDSQTPVYKVSYNRAIPGTDYWIGTGLYVNDLDATFWRGIWRAVYITVILSFFLASVSYFISRSITRPLYKIRTRMLNLAAGDTSSPVPEKDAMDEVGEMARAVEVFRENKKYARELENINNQIEQQALHDPLTGLANRRFFNSHFSQLREKCAAENESIYLLHIDLDRFKDTNDSMGHAAGDLVLKHTASVLRANTREHDFIARIGGDEFLVISPTVNGETRANNMACNIIHALSEPLPYEGRFCRFGASIGIASESAKTVELKKLIRSADMALYRAKDKGRNRYEFFSESMELEVTDRNRTTEEFLNGLDLGHLVPFYQPQFDVKTLDVVGVEVLARWLHPEKGVLTPDKFLSIAEDQKVMGRINQAVAIQALRDCILLRNAGINLPKIAVNFSLDSLKDPELLTWLDNLMPFPAEFAMELIESISFENCDEIVRDNLMMIKDRGIEIEIDDFGSGHASILGLLEVQPHRLKIDRKLIEPIIESEFHKKLLASIVEMSASLGTGIIAEGVETMEQLEYLKTTGVQSFQGYVLARPMPFNDLKAFLENESWRQAA